MADLIQHEDFGEKIGGAKKDLWSGRGLYAADLEDMNGREADKYVKKDNIWKKPDYEALIQSGVPVGVAYFIKKVRDSISAAPQYSYRTDNTPEARLARQKQYIETVREIQAVMEDVRTLEQAMAAFQRFAVDKGYLEKDAGGFTTYYKATEKGRENTTITNKLIQTLHVRSVARFTGDFEVKAIQEQFGVPKADRLPAGYEIGFYNGDGKSYSANEQWAANTYYVRKKYQILEVNFESREAALKWAQEHARQQGRTGKQRFVPPQLTQVKRDGPDYRGGHDMVGQDYLDTFGFRGGEFGNWMNQNDRQASLNMGFDALKDLAAVLQVSQKDISYGGVLAIAFGARGSGSAVAHYEPLRKVINLTKMRGAGSLAHEWWHGLDDFLGEQTGVKGFLSEHSRKSPLMEKLVDTIKYKPQTLEEAQKSMEQLTARYQNNAERAADSAMLYALRRYGDEKTQAQYESLKTAFLAGEPGMVEKMSTLKKQISGHVIRKEDREGLQYYEARLRSAAERTEVVIGKTETDYYRNSQRMDKEMEKDGGYWASNVEMTARAFACYVMDKLPHRSDYLAGHAECALAFVQGKDGGQEILKAYPTGEERKTINKVFDELMTDLKLQHIFTHEESARPLEAPAVPAAASEQISLFSEKPSVIGQLASAKASEVKRQPAAKKSHEPER